MKRGFGLIEVIVASLVLAFLLVGLNIMQKGNREAVLRIRSRDAAQIVAQDFIDSLSRLGLSSIATGDMQAGERDYEWRSANGASSRVTYTISASVTDNTVVPGESKFGGSAHVSSKKVDLTVSWPFKNSTQSISVSRIVR